MVIHHNKVIFCIVLLTVTFDYGLLTIDAQTTTYDNLQKIGCYISPSDNRLWVAAAAINPKYLPENFNYRLDLYIKVKMTDNEFYFSNDDFIINSISDFNLASKKGYNLLKYSLVVDYSSSITDMNLNIVTTTLTNFVNKLPRSLESQIIRFSEQSDISPFSTNNQIIINKLQQSLPYERGGTALHDILIESSKQLMSKGSDVPIRLIIALTDGKDTASSTFKDKQRFIKIFTRLSNQKRFGVFIVGVTDHVDHDLLKSISRDAYFGHYIYAPKFPDVDKAFEIIQEMIRRMLIFRIPRVGPDQGKISIYLGTKMQNGRFKTFQTIDCLF